MAEYEEQYRELFRQHSLSNIFLVTPESSPGRIRKIDELTEGFIYALSSSSTTGKNMDATTRTDDYFRQLHEMKLNNPLMIGFGVSDRKSFQKVVSYSRGAIIGSDLIRMLNKEGANPKNIRNFIDSIN